ncbi:unnamed protein product [Schistocephalus solidus]|uniref:Proliferation-associated protein 2G4 n=1 Tax=Schistocephalus solidus TaxID=70667 RepID=A0A183TEY7_SCHSO|nr:unnamed protein product [Schistocephalus solidus]
MSDYDSDEEPTASDETVLNKYKVAAECAHTVLQELLKLCTDGANIIELCSLGDKRIVEETSKLYKKEKELKKGIAFPTTISVNNIVCHYSPIDGEENSIMQLKQDDLVKIDIGAHIDGFAAVVGHTFVVGAKADTKITGRKADVILAAYNAAEATMRLLRPGNDNFKITDVVSKVASEFNCKPVEGVQSHLMHKSVFDGEKSIVLNPTEEQKKAVDKCTFEMYEAWLVDIVISTGEGKTKEENARPTIYKKNETVYHLKMKASRLTHNLRLEFYSEVSSKFQIYPFNIRGVDDIKKARFAATECSRHNVITPMTVLSDREDEFVAQFKFTVLLMPNGPMRITGLPFDPTLYKSDYKIKDAELKELMSQPIKASGGKKKKPAATT